MIAQMSGVILNIILDPILIFGFFGFPRLETVGAALATVISQIFSMCLSIYFNYKHNKEIHFTFKEFRPDKPIAEIYKNNLKSFQDIKAKQQENEEEQEDET